MSETTPKVRAELRKLMATATPPPWLLDGDSPRIEAGHDICTVHSFIHLAEQCRANRDLIAALRNHAASLLADTDRVGELERELGERNLEQSLDFKEAQRRAVEAEAKLTKAVKGLEKIIRKFNESRSPMGQHNHGIDIAREALAEIGETQATNRLLTEAEKARDG